MDIEREAHQELANHLRRPPGYTPATVPLPVVALLAHVVTDTDGLRHVVADRQRKADADEWSVIALTDSLVLRCQATVTDDGRESSDANIRARKLSELRQADVDTIEVRPDFNTWQTTARWIFTFDVGDELTLSTAGVDNHTQRERIENMAGALMAALRE